MPTRRLLRLVAAGGFWVGLILAGALPAVGQDDATDLDRLVKTLGLTAGQTVAEIGAGSGTLTVGVARVVGPTGTVYGNELDPRQRKAIARAAERAGVGNVTVIEGRETETNLPAACCHAVFMRNVYHHVTDRAAMNGSLLASLVPGGRIAVIDFPPRGSHGVSEAVVRAELARAGFEAVELVASGARWFMVTGTRPGR